MRERERTKRRKKKKKDPNPLSKSLSLYLERERNDSGFKREFIINDDDDIHQTAFQKIGPTGGEIESIVKVSIDPSYIIICHRLTDAYVVDGRSTTIVSYAFGPPNGRIILLLRRGGG